MGRAEQIIQSMIKEYLEYLGYWVIRVQCGQVRVKGGVMHLARTGTADLITELKDGRLFAIETKTPDGRLSDEQKEFRAYVLQCGGVYCCARSIEDIKKLLSSSIEQKPILVL